MRINTLLTVLLFLWGGHAFAQSIRDISFKTLDGEQATVRAFPLKKMLFIVAPLDAQDPVYQQLVQFNNVYRDSITIVAVLSVEHGYTDANKASLAALYAGMGVTLTEPMQVQKASGDAQSALMDWLTDKTKNYRFDRDADKIGTKFFVSENGSLYAVMSRETSLAAPIITRIMHAGQHRP